MLPVQQAPVTPTVQVDIQATAAAVTRQEQQTEQQSTLHTPTPALMPVTGASGAANVPATLLIGALTLSLFVGGSRLRERLRSK